MTIPQPASPAREVGAGIADIKGSTGTLVIPVTVRTAGVDMSALGTPKVEVESYPLTNVTLDYGLEDSLLGDDSALDPRISDDDDEAVELEEQQVVEAARSERPPSAKEEAAAAAARARLYGGGVDRSSAGQRGDEERPAAAALVLPSGPEPVAVDVEYPSREELRPVEGDDLTNAAATALLGLGSGDWVEVVNALNGVRQLSVHHSSVLSPLLPANLPAFIKCVKSLRSSVCKTALLCLADLVLDLGDALLPLLDVGGATKPATSLLSQLLLKASSNDKRFVIEEAERCLDLLCAHLSPAPSTPSSPLTPSTATLKCAATRPPPSPPPSPASPATLANDLPAYLRTAGDLISDKTPQAREAARSIATLVRAAFQANAADGEQDGAIDGSEGKKGTECGAEEDMSPWEAICRATLGVSSALAVLKATSV